MSRPRLVDYFLILLGCGLSLILAELSGLKPVLPDSPLPAYRALVVKVVPQLLFLPAGILLMWPVFYTLQWLFGRAQSLTAGEWLWGLAWLGALVLTIWVIWKGLGTLPEFMSGEGFRKGMVVGHVVAVLALAAIALVVLLIGLIGRWQQPWTHAFALVLMLWPVLPLAVLWLWNVKLE
jgi:hypothetical protein